MRIIKPLIIIEDDLAAILPNGFTAGQHAMKKIEHFSRKCYKSEGKMTDESYKEFVPRLFSVNKHVGIAEHRFVSVTFITDRGISHEGVRHRMAAYLQESSRYCDYSKKGMTFIQPPWLSPAHADWSLFTTHLAHREEEYRMWMADKGWKPEQARYWLPTGVKTEYAATLNFGSWINFVAKRHPDSAHPQMRQCAIPLLRYFQEQVPELFRQFPVYGDGTFTHRGQEYEQAKVVINPFYEQVEFEEVV